MLSTRSTTYKQTENNDINNNVQVLPQNQVQNDPNKVINSMPIANNNPIQSVHQHSSVHHSNNQSQPSMHDHANVFQSAVQDQQGITNQGDQGIPINQENSQNPDKSSTTEIAKSFHSSEMNIFNNHNDSTRTNPNDYIIKNVDFAKITEAETQQFIKNINVGDHSGQKIVVSLSNDKFNFYDSDKQHMGHFTVDHLVRYVGEVYDDKKQFMRHFNSKEYLDAKELIENFVCVIDFIPKIGYASIVPKNHSESAFMGDVELIVKLNKFLHSFLKTKLAHELKYVDPKYRKKIEHIVNQLVYTMLNYTMGLISIISSDIKGKPEKKDLAVELMKYSVGTVYRISKFVQEQVGMLGKSNKDIEKLMVTSIKMRGVVGSKMNRLIEQIEIQNRVALKKELSYKLAGGSKDASDEEDNSSAKNENSSDEKPQEIINLNSSDDNEEVNRDEGSNSSIELSRSVDSIDYNVDDETHFSAIFDV